jgi:hypothetical protein
VSALRIALVVLAGAAGCGGSFLKPSPSVPIGADKETWDRALGILRDAAAGRGAYRHSAADSALSTLRIFNDRDTLVTVARGADLWRAAGAVGELAQLDAELADVEIALHVAADPDETVRARAPEPLGLLLPHRAADPRLLATLQALAADAAGPVRREAFAALRAWAEKAPPPPAPWLLAGLHDEEGAVRAAAATTLGHLLKSPPAAGATATGPVADLMALLDDPHEAARAAVMRALARTAAGRTRLEPLLTSPSMPTRVRAATLLGAVAHTGSDARSLLGDLLHAADERVRRAAVVALHGIADRFEPPAQDSIAAALVPLLADELVANRVSAARVLLTWNLPDYREPALIALRPIAELDDRDALDAANALAAMDDPRGDGALIRLCGTAPESSTRALAALYLSRVDGDHVLPALARALHDPDDAVRVEAAAAMLRKLRPR